MTRFHRGDIYGAGLTETQMHQKPINYAKWYSDEDRHHARFRRYVERFKLCCQECGGAGGEKEVILDDGSGPWHSCGFCEGTGYVSPWMRGQWLRWKRMEKAA